MRLLFLIGLLFSPFSFSSECAQYIGTCDFYLCHEELNSCGAGGYNLAYGYKYCDLSLNKLKARMTTQFDSEWVDKTVQCLQVNMESNPADLSCSEIKARSYDSHPDCYVRSGFCQLSVAGQAEVMNLLKFQLFNLATWPQALRVMQACLFAQHSAMASH